MRHKATRAGDQQERRECLAESYIAGFVDGEGTFHVAFQRAPWTRFGWQVIPEFRVNQHGASRSVLEAIRQRLGCGHLKLNHARSDDDRTVVLAVRDRNDLLTKVIPFFERHPLHTVKRRDFATFAAIVKAMARKKHLTREGFRRIVIHAFSMNAHGSQRKYTPALILNALESSETIRLVPQAAGKT